MPRRALLVVNPAAGRRASAARAELVEKLGARFELAVLEIKAGMSARKALDEALATRPDLVIAHGGDGTVSTVAAGATAHHVPMGIVPGGTANSLARALGIPMEPDAAIEILESGVARTIDGATVSAPRSRPRNMVLFTTVGLHAETIGGTPREWKKRWGPFAYIAFGLKKILELAPFDVELESEDQRIECRVNAVTVANLAPPTTIWAQGPRTLDAGDGQMDVTLVAAASALDAIATGVHLLRSAQQNEASDRENVGFFRCRRLLVRATPAQRVVVDGEKVGRTPVTVTCMPGALVVIAPPQVDAETSLSDGEEKLDGLPEVRVEPV